MRVCRRDGGRIGEGILQSEDGRSRKIARFADAAIRLLLTILRVGLAAIIPIRPCIATEDICGEVTI